MDFDKPLPKLAGYVVYTTLLDFIDTYVQEYTRGSKGKEFPSLRNTTDMILTLLNDIKKLDVTGLDSIEDPGEAVEEINKRLSAFRNAQEGILDSRELGLFVEDGEFSTKRAAIEKVEEPLKPLKISSKADRDWLRASRISYK